MSSQNSAPHILPSHATAPPQSDVPISSQAGWSPPNTIYPAGLRYLMNLDYLFVNQKIEFLQAFIGWETKNRYTITNLDRETIFYVAEESGTCERLCLSSYRPCEFYVFDKNRQEIFRMVRPFRCDSCCCPCYLQTLEVYSENILLGSVTQEWSLLQPTFYIRNASGQPVLIIKGPMLCFCIDVTFKIKSMDEKHRVGTIRKKWSGFGQEFFTVSDLFGITFPRDLDVKIKAVLLGASLLIDYMYFEED
ncbi:hypothetical protein HN011_006075 [Eciton burchellii]|nr:hypothetical protein HN011_006075 [Eciton burchellii]